MSKLNRNNSVWRTFTRNRLAVVGLVLIVFWVVMALLAPVISPYDPTTVSMSEAFTPPMQGGHLMGTDNYGRDILTRVLYGARVSIWVGLISVGISFCIGVPLGSIAGYYGGAASNVIMRFMDGLSAFPSLVLAIAIASAIGRGTTSAMVAAGIVGIPQYARLMFAQTVSVKEKQYIEASRAVGVKTSEIILKHILPNCLAPLMVRATMGMGFAILTVSSLSFLGMGVQPPDAEWGSMISEGRRYVVSGEWWLTAFPGLGIMTSILGFNLLGDGVRDILDPRNRSGS